MYMLKSYQTFKRVLYVDQTTCLACGHGWIQLTGGSL